ncbi:YjfI family protein [Bacillus sp. NP157]|nr:YjfI family protein [Bacillus sp. NP157]
MPPTKQVTTGAKRQKAFRDRMTRMGMTIPRIYMSEGEQGLVRDFLRHHRHERTDRLIGGMDLQAMSQRWTTQRLFDALQEHAGVHQQLSRVWLQATPASIELALASYGDQPVHLVVTEHEILMTTLLCDQAAVKDPLRFNEACLRLGPNMPLSNVGLVGSHYILFGQLSARSPLANIVEELDVMGQNVIDAQAELSELIG